ncbi:MAG: hypothetical protein WC711_01885 [Candidatus Staskawiczbacteria bacterium]
MIIINLNKKVSSRTGYVVLAIAVIIFLGITWSAQILANSI